MAKPLEIFERVRGRDLFCDKNEEGAMTFGTILVSLAGEMCGTMGASYKEFAR